MIKVEAIIRQERLDDVKVGLANEGFFGMTMYNVRGRGRQKGYVLDFRGRELRVDLLPKVKIELVIDDRDLDKVVNLISKNAYTGEIGDGKIFIYPVKEVIRIRTGEKGLQAI
ncbi:MAG: P-II family nitrogen regulator [Nitrososphaerales archaeon]